MLRVQGRHQGLQALQEWPCVSSVIIRATITRSAHAMQISTRVDGGVVGDEYQCDFGEKGMITQSF